MVEFIMGMVVAIGFFVGIGLLDRKAFRYYLENSAPKNEKPVKSPAEE